jgi:hypothetical protein
MPPDQLRREASEPTNVSGALVTKMSGLDFTIGAGLETVAGSGNDA